MPAWPCPGCPLGLRKAQCCLGFGTKGWGEGCELYPSRASASACRLISLSLKRLASPGDTCFLWLPLTV